MADGLPPAPLTAQARHNCFMAVKEALHNAAKHAGADEVWLRLHCEGTQFVVIVEDNGRGFDPSAAVSSGNGLHNMRARQEAADGRTDFHSRPGGGTRVRFSLPLEAPKRPPGNHA